MRRIGVLQPFAESEREAQMWMAAFREDLQKLGWVEDRNIQIDIRWGAIDAQSRERIAKELVALRPHILLTQSSGRPVPLRTARGTRAYSLSTC
jgi:putative ABC transport system substrate-binding protein